MRSTPPTAASTPAHPDMFGAGPCSPATPLEALTPLPPLVVRPPASPWTVSSGGCASIGGSVVGGPHVGSAPMSPGTPGVPVGLGSASVSAGGACTPGVPVVSGPAVLGSATPSVPMVASAGSGRVSYGALNPGRVLAADSPEALRLLQGGQSAAGVAVGVTVATIPGAASPRLPPREVPVQVEASVPVPVEASVPVPVEASVPVPVEAAASSVAAVAEAGPIIPPDAAARGGAQQVSLSGFMRMSAEQTASSLTLPMVMTEGADAVAPAASHDELKVTNPAEELSSSTTLPYVVVTKGASWSGDASVATAETLPPGTTDAAAAAPLPIVAMPVIKDPLTPPFSQLACGMNLQLSEDRYTATRSCGCRESAAVGEAPLQRQRRGLFFEVTVQKVVEGWLGGLAVGVTHTAPASVQQRVPDKACNIPRTFVIGYSGSAHLNGIEARCQWQPDRLREGQRVGVLITGDGREDMVVFVDEEEVLRVEGSALHDTGLRPEPLYPVVDVFNATLAVSLTPYATAPEP